MAEDSHRLYVLTRGAASSAIGASVAAFRCAARRVVEPKRSIIANTAAGAASQRCPVACSERP